MNQVDPMLARKTGAFLKESREINRRIVGAINAGHRMKLLEEKNRLIEQYENEAGLSEAKPAPLPDLPVFDLRAMDDLITREKELKSLAAIEPPVMTWKSKLGLGVALAIFMGTVTVLAVQYREFKNDVRPVLTSQEGRRLQVQQILQGVGNREVIQASISIEELEAKKAQLRLAVQALALGGTDQALEQEVSKLRVTINNRIAQLQREQEQARR